MIQLPNTTTVLTGREAYDAAMQDSSVPIFLRDWRGRLVQIDRGEATKRALMGNPKPLYVELRS